MAPSKDTTNLMMNNKQDFRGFWGGHHFEFLLKKLEV